MALSVLTPDSAAPGQQVEQLKTQVRWLELRVKDLEAQLFGRKSEQRRGAVDETNLEWTELLGEVQALAPTLPVAPVPAKAPGRKSAIPRGPKPIDPALPREVIKLADPALKELFCPVTKRPMQPAFVETLEVLARRPAMYYVQHYERTVFTSPAKTAPVYAEWPADALPRARVHASIVAHIAAAHFCEHQPYYAVHSIVRPMPDSGLCRAE